MEIEELHEYVKHQFGHTHARLDAQNKVICEIRKEQGVLRSRQFQLVLAGLTIVATIAIAAVFI